MNLDACSAAHPGCLVVDVNVSFKVRYYSNKVFLNLFIYKYNVNIIYRYNPKYNLEMYVILQNNINFLR